jgi:hypothetical protein
VAQALGALARIHAFGSCAPRDFDAPFDGSCGMTELEPDECIRCGEAPPADEAGYCGHCYWVVKAEFEDGFHALRAYLGHWSAFRDWEARSS